MPLVHNRGRKIGKVAIARKIEFPRSWDEKGNPVRDEETGKIIMETLLPEKHKEITQEQFDHLRAIFHGEIVNLSDPEEMKRQFEESVPEEQRRGYMAPDEVAALVQKEVQKALKAGGAAPEEAEKPKENGEDEIDEIDEKVPVDADLAARIDGMDRLELIATVENEGFDIDVKKYKNTDALKKAIFKAYGNKKPAEEAAE